MFLSFPRISKSNQDNVPKNHAWAILVQSRILKITVCKFFGGNCICIFKLFPRDRRARNLLSWKEKKKIVLFRCLSASTPVIILKSFVELQKNLIEGLESNISARLWKSMTNSHFK